MKEILTVLQNFILADDVRVKHFLSDKGISCTAKVLGNIEWVVNYKRNDDNYLIAKEKYDELLPYWREHRIIEDDNFTWAKSTLELLEQVKTPYVFYLIEDRMFYQTTEEEFTKVMQDVHDNDIGFFLIGKIPKYGLVKHPLACQDVGVPPYEYETDNIYFYEGKNAPPYPISNDAIYRVDVLKKSLERIINTHEKIPRVLEYGGPNWYRRDWPEMKHAVPKNHIITSDDDSDHELGK
ncbi:hypothetical protein CMI47_16420 [Candidatus Pacearchaeota archaeon]|nr:hypothetical protein [Candidatus Pacearchaeota archaeon]